MSNKYDGSRGPPAIEGMTSLKVDNLTYRTNMEDLEHYFGKYGEVGDIYIPRDRHRRESRGFAFVRYREQRDAEDAMDSLDGAVIDGREIRVQLAKYGRPTESHGGGGGRSNYADRRGRSPDRDRKRRRHSRSRSGSRGRRRYSRSESRSPKRSSRSPRRSRSRSNESSPRQWKSKRDSRSRSRSSSRDSMRDRRNGNRDD